MSGLSEDEAQRLADSVVESVRETEFPGLALPGPVTCSVGAVCGELDSDMTAESLVKAADELMYRAKCSGKDRCCFRPLRDMHNVDLLESNEAASDACASAIRDAEAQGADETILPETFRRIATELNRDTPQHFLDMRKHVRKHLLAPCRLTALTAATLELESEDAYVRNISTGGVGILTTRSMRRGQPAEIAILVDDEPRLFVAGVVAFCRHVEGAIHEIGLQLFTHSKEPILSRDPISAIRNLDWVAVALGSTRRAAVALT